MQKLINAKPHLRDCKPCKRLNILNKQYLLNIVRCLRFEKKANKMLARASQTFEYSTGISIAKRSDIAQPDESSTDGGSTGDQELEQYLMLLLGLQRLLIRERQLLVDVVPKARHNEIFTRLSQSSVDMVVKDAEVSVTLIKAILYLILIEKILLKSLADNHEQSSEEHCTKRMVSRIGRVLRPEKHYFATARY